MNDKDTQPQTSTLLEVDALKTYFSTRNGLIRAVDGVSFSIDAGATLGLAGESGSGKTQTALSIMGLVRDLPGIVAGGIRIKGTDVLEGIEKHISVEPAGDVSMKKSASWRAACERRMATMRGRVVSMVFQEPKSALIPYYTVREHFFESYKTVLRLDHVAEIDARAASLLTQFYFDDPHVTLEQYPHQMSGGETQRIMIALSMIGDPGLLLADEPTTALDAVTQRVVLEQLQAAIERRNMGLILISHNLAILGRLVEFIAIMFGGRIVEYGRTADIIRNRFGALHPYTRALLSAFRPNQTTASTARPASVAGARLNHAGCVYYHRCTLKDTLDARWQQKCLDEPPPPIKVNDVHRVACWAHA